MKRSFFMPIAFLATIIGSSAPSAFAGLLSLRFAGGGHEITLGPSESATIQVMFGFGNLDGVKSKLTGIDARFDVGSLAAGIGGNYVVDGSSAFTVTRVVPYPTQSWTTVASSPLPAPFNGGFFLSAGDPNGLHGPHEFQPPGPLPPVPLASYTIQRNGPSVGDVYVVLRVLDPLPAVYNGVGEWANRFGPETVTGPTQFEIGRGNPGDARPTDLYHGFEALQPLIIHTLPEPGALALLLVAGSFAVRRRRAPIKRTGA